MTDAYPGLLKQNRMFRLSEGTGQSMEKIHHHVLQFVDFGQITSQNEKS